DRSRLVRKTGEDDLLEMCSLLGNGMSNPRVRMAVERNPPGAYCVKNTATVLQIQVRSFSSLDADRSRNELHLSIGMPYIRLIPLQPFLGIDWCHKIALNVLNLFLNTSRSVGASMTSRCGIVPRIGTPPYSSMASSFPGFSSPITTQPAIGIFRARNASSESSV